MGVGASEARAILARQYAALFGAPPPWPALRLLLAQSRGEGNDGAGWGSLGGYDAEGNHWENNWGAVQAKMGPPCPFGTFEHGDSKPTPSGQKPFRWCFQGYLTPDDGALDFLKHALVYRKAAARAVLTGDARAYAEALYGDGKAPYFGGYGATVPAQIQSYVTMLERNAALVDKELSLSPPELGGALAQAGVVTLPTARRAPSVALLAAAGALAFFIFRE